MEENSPPRENRLLAVLAVLALGSAAAGAWFYHSRQSRVEPAPDASGFDLNEVSEQSRAAATAPGPANSQSSLQMVKTGMGDMRFGSQAQAPGGFPAAKTFAELCRASETKVRVLGERYTRRYPIIAQYGRDWMSYPDLKKLNDDYMRDHDPVKFLRGLAKSKNFGTIVRKYAGQPAIQSFVKEGMRQAPAGLLTAAMNYLNEDSLVKNLVDNVTTSLGLPAGLLGGSSRLDIDPKKIESMMNLKPN